MIKEKIYNKETYIINATKFIIYNYYQIKLALLISNLLAFLLTTKL